MSTIEKESWNALYLASMAPFAYSWIGWVLTGSDNFISAGWVGVGCLVLVTVALSFRAVYLSGRNSK